MTNILAQLGNLLKKDERLKSENDQFLKNKAQELALKNDPDLLKLLLSDKAIKQHFFFKVGEALIFDKDKFVRFVSNKQFLPDSYTAFQNKIGFITGNKYLSENKDVVLVWPYKDCILEGGMTKEDQKRDEIFYNETLAPDDITRLLDEKVLTNFKRIDKEGTSSAKATAVKEHKLDGFKRDDKGNIKDNLIIKGNNLLALSSIKKEFAGKVKLIYIDPPYNTGNDGFKYNDSFNHSSWLTFMKNRLDVAKQLLSSEGSIFISIDDREQAYLKILCDEIFGKENFLADIIWKSTKSVTNTAIISVSHTHNLVYFKNIEFIIKNRTEFRLKENGEGFLNPDNDSRGPWKADPFQVGGWRPNQQYEIKNPNTGIIYKPNDDCSWKNDFKKFKELLKDNRIIFGTDGKAGPQRKRFLSEALERGKVSKTIWDDVGTTTNGTQHLNQLLGRNLFSNPKPESFIQKIIELSTKENDIVLDFFAGSGTTLAVAHKTGRQYIGIEQMDYIHDLPESRLKKVIDGEQGGISKAVNWQGGGDFVYMELAEWNEKIVKRIRDKKTAKQLMEIWSELKDNTFLSWRVNEKIFDANASDFADLNVDNQKKFLIECLSKNTLYVNLSEIEDEEYEISEGDKKLNREFYK
jgi:adenine-specific DNA-methyltransferase